MEEKKHTTRKRHNIERMLCRRAPRPEPNGTDGADFQKQPPHRTPFASKKNREGERCFVFRGLRTRLHGWVLLLQSGGTSNKCHRWVASRVSRLLEPANARWFCTHAHTHTLTRSGILFTNQNQTKRKKKSKRQLGEKRSSRNTVYGFVWHKSVWGDWNSRRVCVYVRVYVCVSFFENLRNK